MMLELTLTKKSKRNARKIRQKNENKWLIYRVLSVILFVVCIISFFVGIFIVANSDYDTISMYITVFSISLIGYVVTRSLLTKASSHWIQDRLNERVWIEGNQVYHFMQTSFAAGLNTYNADERAYLFVMDISSISNARYDDKSRRIEFVAEGNGFHYADYYKNIVDKEWPLKRFEAIFYDAMNPSLYETLKKYGVEFEVGTIHYKFSNQI